MPCLSRPWFAGVTIAVVLVATMTTEVPAVQRSTAVVASPVLERFIVQSDGHPMTVWGRRPASPRGTVLLVHGRTWSSRPDFDLQVPGLQRSVMSALASRGFAAYAVDLRGYGATPRDPGTWVTPWRCAADVLNVLRWIAEEHPGLPKPAVAGWSRGAAVSMLGAQVMPSRMSALVLFGFVIDPAFELPDAEEELADVQSPLIKNTVESAKSDFISPRVTPKAVVDAFVAQALRSDPLLAPLSGDLDFLNLNAERLHVPSLVIYGDRDPGVSGLVAKRFVARLAAREKELVVLPGADHAAHIENTHEAWVNAVVTFISRPTVLR